VSATRAAVPVSEVKYPTVQGLVRALLGLPDFICVYDLLLVGESTMEGRRGDVTRHVETDALP
jgi:hypothetical protein